VTRAARNESGQTLVELMIGMVIGLVVLGAAFMILDAATPLAARTQDRIDAYQRGRLTMDVISSELRSQVCLPGAIPAIIPVNSNQNEIWFYSNTGDDAQAPQRRRIYLAGNAIMEDLWKGTFAANGSVTFQVDPTSTRTLISPVALVPGADLFSYWGFDANLPAAVNQPIGIPVSATNAQKVVQVDVSFVARPTRSTAASRRDSTFQQSVFFRTADPTDPAKGPKC
jgi:Prokaryotic N-terminal methylation motif